MKEKKELKRYKVGDRSKGRCTQCGLVETVFKIRDLPIGDEEENVVAVAKGILVGVCTKCGRRLQRRNKALGRFKRRWRRGRNRSGLS